MQRYKDAANGDTRKAIGIISCYASLYLHLFGENNLNQKKTFSNTVPTALMPSIRSISAARSSHSTIYTHLIKVAELRQYWKGNIYPERDRAVYEEHFIKANVWKRNLKLNQISDFWKPVVPF